MRKTINIGNKISTFGSLLPQRNFSSEKYRFGYQGSEVDEEIEGDRNTITTFNREANLETGQWWSLDSKPHPGWSSYSMMSRNPVLYNDVLGDTSEYYNAKGKLLHTSYDQLENAMISVSDEKLKAFNNKLTWAKSDELSSDDLNKTLRTFGTGYAIDDFKEFYNQNKEDYNAETPWLANEHKTFLYMKNGLVRPGKENIPGDPDIVVGGTSSKGALGKMHTHPNAGKMKSYPSYYTHNPSSDDYTPAYVSLSKKHYDVVISNKYIYFINSEASPIALPFNHTFTLPSPVKFQPWTE